MKTLDMIVKRFNLEPKLRGYTEIPNFGRDQLAELFAWLDFREGAEIGTERGVYAETLCQKNPMLRLHCVDPWEKHDAYKEPVFDEVMDRNYNLTVERLKPYNCIIRREYSAQALEAFAEKSLDFVYLDGNHAFESVVFDLHEWSKKVHKGGIVAGHDYYRPNTKGKQNVSHHVIEAVTGYTDAYRIRPWFVLGRDAKVKGEIRDHSRSWMFIKE
jgi:hypothetical protein